MESDLYTRFLAFIGQHQLMLSSDKVLVAVSGGADSVVLAHLMHKSPYPSAIAHMNFQLRGRESDDDEAFVRKLAPQLGVEVFVQKVDTAQYAQKNQLSTQVAARDLRYTFFEELAQQHGFTKIAVAHHADDQAETFFINLQRRSGIRGLAGIPVRREKIIRPLLFATRQEIEDYANINKLVYRNDSSNSSNYYLRNRIRHHLLPKAEEVLPGFMEAIPAVMSHLRETDVMIRQMISQQQSRLFRRVGEEVRISLNDLQLLTPLHTWLHYLLEDFGFNGEVLQSAAEVITNRESGRIFFSDKFKMVIDRSSMIILRKKAQSDSEEVLIYAESQNIHSPLNLSFQMMDKNEVSDLKVPPTTALFDLERLEFPLLLRKWKHGDRFQPFGMKGSRLVSDFLIDAKVDVIEKERVYVLTSGEQIIWVVGYRAASGASVTHKTKKIFKVHILQET